MEEFWCFVFTSCYKLQNEIEEKREEETSSLDRNGYLAEIEMVQDLARGSADKCEQLVKAVYTSRKFVRFIENWENCSFSCTRERSRTSHKQSINTDKTGNNQVSIEINNFWVYSGNHSWQHNLLGAAKSVWAWDQKVGIKLDAWEGENLWYVQQNSVRCAYIEKMMNKKRKVTRPLETKLELDYSSTGRRQLVADYEQKREGMLR